LIWIAIGLTKTGPRATLPVADMHAALAEDGFAVVKSFLTPKVVTTCVTEAIGVTHTGHASQSRTIAYFSVDDPDLPTDHPKR